MPEPEQLPALAKLAEEFLTALRSAAQTAALGGDRPDLVIDVSDKASRFTAAAAASPDLARAVEASPGLAALSLASPPLAQLAERNPDLAELAVVSPNLAQVALRAPEMAELARASPPLAANIEMVLTRLANK